MGPRLRCTVRALGPGRPPRRLKRVLLKLIEELLKKPRRSGPLRHSLVLIVEKKRRGQTPPPASPTGQSRLPALISGGFLLDDCLRYWQPKALNHWVKKLNQMRK
ncbi:UNVERIFIED_CONTAM: hypothetical protein K2H54_039323 [Gekko kuhli]